MNINKPLLIAGVVTTLGVASLGVSAVSADARGAEGPAGLIDKISQRFNLNKDEVKSVFDDQREEHRAEMQKTNEERLTQAVADGKLTEEQKTKILAKQAELRTQMESLQDKTREERRDAMRANHEALEQWAEENDIPEEYLHLNGGHRGGRGHGGPGGNFQMRANNPAAE